MPYFDKILIANRGEIAVRLIQACRELGITAVAVYSDADRVALHVRQADEAYHIGPAAASASYLNVPQIVAAAQRSGAQAIHPGYGFLSERAHFARACEEAGLTFIGPSPETIELMGSKITAKRLAESVDVPTVPGYLGDDQSPERLRSEAERLGFPLLIKASAGGGGKGMRTVYTRDAFDDALEGAQREARAAFGDDTVFLERLVVGPRHIEIQVLADAYSNCVHLFERECSIQRRHQKIIEESPSVALTPDLRAEMGAAAVRLAQAVSYRNAGTVEFMLDENGHYYFLEMNTRLQVEHPVTESVTGLDLAQLQIAIAAGETLPFQQADLTQRGHAIEVRVYAEDPVAFLPSTGRVALFAPPAGPGIRNDAGLESGDEVTVNYDPMLAKLIVSAADRNTAIARLRQALDDYTVLGVTTNLPLLRAIAASDAFVVGETRTDFLNLHNVLAVVENAPTPEVLAAAAISDMTSAGQLMTNDPWRRGPWRLMRESVPLRYSHTSHEYTVALTQTGASWRVQTGDSVFEIMVVAEKPNFLALQITMADTQWSRIERFWLARDDNDRLVSWRGTSYQLTRVVPLNVDMLGGRSANASGNAGMEAPMPGTIIKVLVEEGQQVVARQPLIVLEAMKMEHVVAAPYDGVVKQLYYAPGSLVSKGATLVDLQEQR